MATDAAGSAGHQHQFSFEIETVGRLRQGCRVPGTAVHLCLLYVWPVFVRPDLICLDLFPEDLLVEFAHAGAWQAVHKMNLVRNGIGREPSFIYALAQDDSDSVDQSFTVGVLVLGFDEGAGSLTPFLMRFGDDGYFLDAGMLRNECLKVQGRKPFPARLDDVFGAIRDVEG